MSTQKEFIEKFRKNKYKIGSEKEDIELIKQDLQNSISQLANDLYSDGIHFVLELIQNADDNNYSGSNNPMLKFVIDEEKILVQNNEIGFTDENVISLCSVGKSKKTKDQGYIGEKGIGFKSVFRISDEPHIFSKGFQFKFKREDKEYGLGYIVPYWIENIPDFIDEKITNILLPLNKEAKELLHKFDEVEPELLIFLRQLSTVEIENKINNVFYKFTKTEENGVVKISGKEREDHFRLISRDLDVPKDVKEDKRDVSNTKLILGFPLNENGTAKIYSEQKVFAFLPTRSYGFKFMIQADFLVPASREDIDKDKKWNKWLRDNISTIFLQSVENFKSEENLMTSFYNYIPVDSDVTDSFFSKVVGQIKSELSVSECVLSESGRYLKPSQLFRASREIRSLIPIEDLLEFFGKEYISTSVERDVDAKILDFLEVATFSINDLFEVLKSTEWLKKQSDEWLIKLYSYLKNKLSKGGINTVKKLQIVRLENGEMESPVKKEIFFPFQIKQDYGFEDYLPFISKEITKNNEDFLRSLGVLNAEPFNIIENYIVKDFENKDGTQNWRSKTEEVRLGYINYIKDNLAEYEKIKGGIERLQNTIQITLKDKKFWFAPKIYLSTEYGNEHDIEYLLSGIENIHFIHPQYIEYSQKTVLTAEIDHIKRKEKINQTKEDWRDFFLRLDVATIPLIEVDLKQGRWNLDTIYHSAAIDKIVAEGNSKKNSMLLKILDQNWNKYYRRFTANTIYYLPGNDYRYNLKNKTKDSEWFEKLKSYKWLPTQGLEIEEPSKLFLDKPEIRKVFGDSVVYLDAEIKNEVFAKALGITSEVTIDTVIKVLKNLVNTNSNDKQRFEKLYSYLNDNYAGNESQIKNYFRDENLIFIPKISSEYISSEKARWKDVSDIFGDYYQYLEKYYPKLKDFFVEKIGVFEKPLARDYANILVEFSEKESTEKIDEEKILNIYKELNKFLKADNSEQFSILGNNWWKEFISKGVFWTNKINFWRNDNDVFVNDDEELYELFNDKDEVAFLEIPKNERPEYIHFIEKTNLKFLSEEIKAQIETSVECEYDEGLTNNINGLLIFLFRYLYHKENPIYERSKDNGQLLEISKLKCYWVLDLNIQYTLHTESAIKDDFLYLDKNRLYVKVDSLTEYGRISLEISKVFGSPKGLSDFIENLLLQSSDEKRSNSLKVKKIGDLPNSELIWYEKNISHPVRNEEIVINFFETTITNDEETQEHDLVLEKHQSNDNDISEINGKHKFQHYKEEINPAESESLDHSNQNETPFINQLEQNLSSSTQKESKTENDWDPEIKPSEVKSGNTEDIIPKLNLPDIPINRDSQTNHKNTSSDGGSNESNKTTLSQIAKRKIGRWGEEFTVNRLREKFLSKYKNCIVQDTNSGFNISVDNQIKVKVAWLNKDGDYGIGRDIEYIENGEKYFIEVKSTKSGSKEIFHISRSEWQLAKDAQDHYSIIRIYDVGTTQARAEEIINPYTEWLKDKLSVQSLTIRI